MTEKALPVMIIPTTTRSLLCLLIPLPLPTISPFHRHQSLFLLLHYCRLRHPVWLRVRLPMRSTALLPSPPRSFLGMQHTLGELPRWTSRPAHHHHRDDP